MRSFLLVLSTVILLFGYYTNYESANQSPPHMCVCVKLFSFMWHNDNDGGFICPNFWKKIIILKTISLLPNWHFTYQFHKLRNGYHVYRYIYIYIRKSYLEKKIQSGHKLSDEHKKVMQCFSLLLFSAIKRPPLFGKGQRRLCAPDMPLLQISRLIEIMIWRAWLCSPVRSRCLMA